MDKYEEIEKIGEGAYGTVFKGRNCHTKDIVALKKIPMLHHAGGVPTTALREISLLRELSSHPCVVKLVDVYETEEGTLCMVFEYMDQDLRQFMRRMTRQGRSLHASLIKSYTFQLLCGMGFCHTHRIVHRDLKPQNLLVNRYGALKLADFGMARVFTIPSKAYTREVMTLWYRPPEILLGSTRYQAGADMWGIGCIISEMVSREPLLPGTSEIDQLFKTFQLLGTPNETTWPSVTKLPYYSEHWPTWQPGQQLLLKLKLHGMDDLGLDLIRRLLVYDPINRISSLDALQHPYFKIGLDPQALRLAQW